MSTWGSVAAYAVALQGVSPSAYYVVSSVTVPGIVAYCMLRHGPPSMTHVLTAWLNTVLCIGIAMSVCLHRYFAHSAFRTSRVFQFVLGVVACLAFQGDPLWWAVMHRRHHKHCDCPGDPHSSARQGVFYAVVGWMANPENYRLDADAFRTLDPTVRTPELHALRHLHPLCHVTACAFVEHFAGYAAMVYCLLLPMWLARFITLLFNHEFHQGRDQGNGCLSQNAARWLAIAVGESQHADHHAHPRRARRPELDPPWHVSIRWLQALGLVWH